MNVFAFSEITAQEPFLDEPDVIERAKSNPALQFALEFYRPPNWWGCGARPAEVIRLATDLGIPVVWVPNVDVIRALLAVPKHQREQVLESHADDIVADCRRALTQCDDSDLANERELVGQAIDAFVAGHHSAAMALAVAVGEPLAVWASNPRFNFFGSRDEAADYERLVKNPSRRDADWKQAVTRLQAKGLEPKDFSKYRLAATELKGGGLGARLPLPVQRRALISPIPHFFADFDPKNPTQFPTIGSRHVTVHRPTVEHLNRVNALRCLMLDTSILREQQDWAIEVQSTTPDDDE